MIEIAILSEMARLLLLIACMLGVMIAIQVLLFISALK